MIDPGLLKFLSDGEQEILRAYEKMFEGQGWQMLLSSFEDQYRKAKHDVLMADSWADNRKAFGRAQVLEKLVVLPEDFAKEFELLALSRKEERQEREEEDELDFE